MSNTVVINGRGGAIRRATVTFETDAYKQHVVGVLVDRLMEICERVKVQVQRNITASSRANGPSAEGEFPHADTGRLRNSIFWSVDARRLQGIVGTPLLYGLWLEYGHGGSGGRRIYPKSARAFSWIDRATGKRVFYRSVVLPPQRPRSFLRRTLLESRPMIRSIMNRPFPEPTKVRTVLG